MYFCLYCLSSKEETVCTAMEGLLERFSGTEHTVWFPKKEVSERRRGVVSKVEKPMFPSYLFVFWGGQYRIGSFARFIRSSISAV